MPSYRTSLLLPEYIAKDRVVHVANSPEFMIYGEDLRIFSIVRAPYEGYPGKPIAVTGHNGLRENQERTRIQRLPTNIPRLVKTRDLENLRRLGTFHRC